MGFLGRGVFIVLVANFSLAFGPRVLGANADARKHQWEVSPRAEQRLTGSSACAAILGALQTLKYLAPTESEPSRFSLSVGLWDLLFRHIPPESRSLVAGRIRRLLSPSFGDESERNFFESVARVMMASSRLLPSPVVDPPMICMGSNCALKANERHYALFPSLGSRPTPAPELDPAGDFVMTDHPRSYKESDIDSWLIDLFQQVAAARSRAMILRALAEPHASAEEGPYNSLLVEARTSSDLANLLQHLHLRVSQVRARRGVRQQFEGVPSSAPDEFATILEEINRSHSGALSRLEEILRAKLTATNMESVGRDLDLALQDSILPGELEQVPTAEQMVRGLLRDVVALEGDEDENWYQTGVARMLLEFTITRLINHGLSSTDPHFKALIIEFVEAFDHRAPHSFVTLEKPLKGTGNLTFDISTFGGPLPTLLLSADDPLSWLATFSWSTQADIFGLFGPGLGGQKLGNPGKAMDEAFIIESMKRRAAFYGSLPKEDREAVPEGAHLLHLLSINATDTDWLRAHLLWVIHQTQLDSYGRTMVEKMFLKSHPILRRRRSNFRRTARDELDRLVTDLSLPPAADAIAKASDSFDAKRIVGLTNSSTDRMADALQLFVKALKTSIARLKVRWKGILENPMAVTAEQVLDARSALREVAVFQLSAEKFLDRIWPVFYGRDLIAGPKLSGTLEFFEYLYDELWDATIIPKDRHSRGEYELLLVYQRIVHGDRVVVTPEIKRELEVLLDHFKDAANDD